MKKTTPQPKKQKNAPPDRKAQVLKKPTYTFKTVFETPYTLRWPGVGTTQQEEIFARCKKELAQYRTAKRSPNKKPSQRQLKKKAQREQNQSSAESTQVATTNSHNDVKMAEATQQTDQPKRGEEEKAKEERPKASEYLCLGVNHVTRALERGELSLVIVCKDADPPRLVQHLPYLAFLKQVPLCALSQKGTTFELGQIFGLKTMLALGFKKRRDSPHRDLIEFVQDRTPKLDIPWLEGGREMEATKAQAGTTTTTTTTTTAVSITKSEGGVKRKGEAAGVEKGEEGEKGKSKGEVRLQPLRIKQVTTKRPRLENK